MLKQLSIFVVNEIGSLRNVTTVLKNNNINIRAIATFDSPEFGILRIIVDKPELARDILVENGFVLKITTVIAVNLEDKPGELDKVLEVIENAGLNLNYIYSFVIRNQNSPLLVMHIDDLEIAKQILTEHGVKMGSLED